MRINTSKKRALIVILGLILSVGLDQLTKQLARQWLNPSLPIDFLGGFIHFELAENTGAFLSFGSTWMESIRFYVFTGAVGVFLIWGIYYLIQRELSDWYFLGMNLLVGGGIGNLIDRATKNSVTDFMLVQIGPLHTGVFNVADMFILSGVILLFLNGKRK